MKLAILMDPLQQLNPKKDTTLAMIHSATMRGVSCAYFTTADMFCEKGELFADLIEISIQDWNQPFKTRALGKQPLTDYDCLLMRKDPPFDMEYIYSTYALELAQKKGVLVANNPQSLRDANEKFFTLHFPQCCPPTLVSKQQAALKEFWQRHQKVIFKPLSGMGGEGIFLVDEQGDNLSVILEVLTKRGQISIMAQQYIPAIKETGDKRILLINGQPIPYALARIPAQGELRGNLAAGAHGEVVPITERDRWLCQQIAPTLQEKGLYFVGVDVIGDYLTEINVTSPTCAREIMTASGEDITGQYIDFLQDQAKLN